MTETLCDSGAVKLKAGLSVSTDLTGDQYTLLINQAEGDICSESRYNWIDAYSGINADFKKILEDAASSKAAIHAITYDMSSYFTKAEAQVLLDVNWNTYINSMKKLKDQDVVEFLT